MSYEVVKDEVNVLVVNIDVKERNFVVVGYSVLVSCTVDRKNTNNGIKGF